MCVCVRACVHACVHACVRNVNSCVYVAKMDSGQFLQVLTGPIVMSVCRHATDHFQNRAI